MIDVARATAAQGSQGAVPSPIQELNRAPSDLVVIEVDDPSDDEKQDDALLRHGRGRSRTHAEPGRQPEGRAQRTRRHRDGRFIMGDEDRMAARARRRQLIEDDRHWSPEMESIARGEILKADMHVFIFGFMARSATKWDNALTVVSGLIGAIAGAGGISSFVTTKEAEWITPVLALLGFIVTVISIISNAWKLKELSANSIQHQVSFAALSRDIMCQLAIPKNERPEAMEYIKSKAGELERLQLSAPQPSAAAEKAYAKKMLNVPVNTAGPAEAARFVQETRLARENNRPVYSLRRESISSRAVDGSSRSPSLETLQALVDAYDVAQNQR